MADVRAIRSRVRRVLVHPIATFLLLLPIAWSFANLPAPSHRVHSRVGALREELRALPKLPIYTPYLGETFVLVREDDRIRIVDLNVGGWSDTADLMRQRPQDVAVYGFTSTVTQRGLWALTFELHTMSLEPLTEINEQVVGEAEFRAALLQHLVKAGLSPQDAQKLQTGDIRKARILWPGILENTVVALAAVLAIASLGWLSPGWRLERRRRRALAQGRCPECGYDMQGLTVERCPECGCAWLPAGLRSNSRTCDGTAVT